MGLAETPSLQPRAGQEMKGGEEGTERITADGIREESPRFLFAEPLNPPVCVSVLDG